MRALAAKSQPETPSLRVWRWGRGWACCSGRSRASTTRKQGRGTPRLGAGKPQSCSCHPAWRPPVGEDPSGLNGLGPPEQGGDSPVPRGPLRSKGQHGDGQHLRGLATRQALFQGPSSVSTLSPCSPRPGRKGHYPHVYSEDAEAQRGSLLAHSLTTPRWHCQGVAPGSMAHFVC